MKLSQKIALFAPLLAVVSITQAHAFGYSCATQSAGGHQISMSINDYYGPAGYPSARYQVDGQQTKGYPTMNDAGSGSFESNDKDMTVDISEFSDEDGNYTLYLTVKSLGLKRVALSCI